MKCHYHNEDECSNEPTYLHRLYKIPLCNIHWNRLWFIKVPYYIPSKQKRKYQKEYYDKKIR